MLPPNARRHWVQQHCGGACGHDVIDLGQNAGVRAGGVCPSRAGVRREVSHGQLVHHLLRRKLLQTTRAGLGLVMHQLCVVPPMHDVRKGPQKRGGHRLASGNAPSGGVSSAARGSNMTSAGWNRHPPFWGSPSHLYPYSTAAEARATSDWSADASS
eukprot:CAMPEP_0181384338 /NCGR_PEP_ID=MMETSP1106-20121128/21899_1 /TAXON_ID=81844 /ORGANISM="Mantoniella antarctica, Strain SL-175" /LENGTH=156 /DNA_ID=CAMNT_0023504177 /DNA_START=281 /DNA_END=749 /DNA_ORIENTATION=+